MILLKQKEFTADETQKNTRQFSQIRFTLDSTTLLVRVRFSHYEDYSAAHSISGLKSDFGGF